MRVHPFLILLMMAPGSAWTAPIVMERVEASVNAQTVYLSDVLKFRQTVLLRNQLDPLFAGTPLAQKGAAAERPPIVNFLVDEKVILSQFPVTDAEAEQEINSIMANNRIDKNALRETLRAQGFIYDDYFELIRVSLAKRNLIDRDIRTRIVISDDDVKNHFYNSYAKGAGVARNYHVKIITIDPKRYKTAAASRETAQRTRQALRAGDSFEEMAKSVSDDASASSGGDLGVLSDDQMSPLVRDTIHKLKVGEVSEVVGNASGMFMILKLQDIVSGEDSRFARVKEELRAQLAQQEYQHQISLWIDRQRQNAHIHLAGAETISNRK